MNRKLIFMGTIFLSAAIMFGGCGKNGGTLSKPSLTGNSREFSEEAFADPDLKYRPLPIIHASEYEHNGVDRTTLDMLKDCGYGGVATNVSFLNDYLENEEMWESLVNNVTYAIEDLGLRVWIYDELHYPSGSAGGIVLREHPEWQAEGLVNEVKEVKKGDRVIIEAPHGHTILFANAYRGDRDDLSNAKNIMSHVADNKLDYTAEEDGIVAVQFYKYFYEGTHAVNNWAELRRCINLLKEEPVQKFIEVTHEQYKARLGKYFGKGIEAFFTDEPSMLGTYFDGPPTTPGVKDPIDPDIPLLPTVNYSSDIGAKFEARRGYSPESYYAYLYGGQSDSAKHFRWDYYKTLAELVSSNYTGQIAAWCGQNNVSLTGHMLLEEDIYMHPVFNGNIMQNLANMQMPGIDLLTALPSQAANWCCTTGKFASSAAHFNGRTQVASEVSDAFDSSSRDMYSKLGAVAVQYAMGINNIGTFYRPHNMSREENRLFTDTIGRMGYLLDGGIHECNVALYYPIEGVYIDTLPPSHLNNFNSNVRTTSSYFSDAARALMNNQIDYDILDYLNLSKCKVEDGALVTPYGERYKAIVVPNTKALEQVAARKLKEAADGGVSIIMESVKGILAGSEGEQGELNKLIEDISNSSNFTLAGGGEAACKALSGYGVKSVIIEGGNREIVACKKKFKDNSVFMFVNTSGGNVSFTVRLNETGACYKLWDVYDGSVKMLSVSTDDGQTSVRVNIPANRCIFITVE